MTAPKLAPAWLLALVMVGAFLLGAFAPWDDLPWNRNCDPRPAGICEPITQAGR